MRQCCAGKPKNAGGMSRSPLFSHIYGSMVLRMKTTIELPDELLVEAKKRAAELRRPLRRLIEDGLRAQLAGGGKAARPRKGRRVRWVTVAGGLPAGVDIADRGIMHEWIRRQR